MIMMIIIIVTITIVGWEIRGKLKWIFGFLKRRGIYWPAEQLSTSQGLTERCG
jgi:hypothetical protein